MLKSDSHYKIILGDCITGMAEMPRESVDLAIFSPPFPSVYSYSSSIMDIGNSEDLKGEARLHFSFFFKQLARVVKPGRVIILHCTQIVRMKRSGGEGMFDFRGMLIRLGERAGLTFEYDWAIRKNPQAQAIRTRSRELQFAGLESDRARSRGCMHDYLLKFTVPGDNAVPIEAEGQVSRNQWIDWAEGTWMDINNTDTLNTKRAKSEEDTRHICPLQLGVIDRLVRLFSDPNEIVFSPFAGIGSEIYTALKLGRRGFGFELKPEYHAEAIVNCDHAIASRESAGAQMLNGFAWSEDDLEPAAIGDEDDE